jgi:hypothetical protein
MKHADIIEELGAGAIAERLGMSNVHVRVWKHRGIPRSAYADLLHHFPALTLDALKAGEKAKQAA